MNDQMNDDMFWARAFMVFLTKTTVFTAASYADDSLKEFRKRFPKAPESLEEARAIIEEAKRSNMEGLKQAMKLHEGHKALDLNDDGSHRHAFNHPQAGCVHCGRTAFEIATSAKSKAAPDASEVVEAAREVLLGFVTIGMNEDTRMCQIPWQSMVKLEKAMHKFRLERTK